ncbi:MAG: hypothetical protein JF597_26515 [Streptomyces sp.]|uniref:hypothetical protein n=1 Tax=Streptomyces sp. TaxID=1931 RepID=UPI0025EAE509|nr:hypothetical protein [Streptomyces sp.]MBW8797024.1 hypothetical protein [Streptomyces sp.]
MPADEVTHGTDVDESRVRTGPRHAAPKKPLFTRFHMPAGKAIASVAMPTAVLMGFGFTSSLAIADTNSTSSASSKSLAEDYKDCVSALDSASPSASASASDKATDSATPSATASDGAKDSTSSGKSSSSDSGSDDTAAPTPSASKSSSSSGDSGSSDSSGSGSSGSGSTATPSASASSTSSSGGGLLDSLGNAIGSILSGGSTTSSSSSDSTASATPSPSASASSGSSSSSSKDSGSDTVSKTVKKVTDTVKDTTDTATKAAGDVTKTAEGAASTAASSASPSPSASSSTSAANCDAATDDVSGVDNKVAVADDPWYLNASSLTLKSADYQGIVEVKTASGKTKKVLKYVISGGTDIGDLHQTVKDTKINKTYHVQAASGSTSTIRNGATTMYTESISGNLFGLIPITFDPDNPPPLNIPLIYFTNVKVVQAAQFGGTLHVPGMHVYTTDGTS